jgi:hypothetical protein
MPYKNKADRNYKHEYEEYQSKPEQIKNRDARNKARAEMMKKGKVHKGDGKDVDHIKPLSQGGKTEPGNLRTESAHDNRSYNRNKDHSVKIRASKKK